MTNKKTTAIFLFLITCFVFKTGVCQEKATASINHPVAPAPVKDTSDDDDDVREFIPSMAYGSNYIAPGRASAKLEPYMEPSFMYNAKSGFTTGFNDYKLLNLPKAFNELDLNVGWDFNYWDNFQASASYMRMIFPTYTKPTPYEEALAMYQNNIDLFASYDLKYVTPGLRFDYFNGRQKITGPKGKTTTADTSNDYYVTFDLSHDFEVDNIFKTKGDLVISPDYTIMGGTRTFYGEKFTQKRKRIITTGSSGSSAFDLADMELDLPVKYKFHNFTFAPEVDYVYIFPASQNPTNQSETANTVTKTPTTGFFVYIMTISYKFTSK